MTLITFCFLPRFSWHILALGKYLNTEFLRKIASNIKHFFDGILEFDIIALFFP